jgi:nucleoside-diphosphate-sugar epimerase
VYAVDNLITGHRENIVPLEKNERFSFHQLDITEPAFAAAFADIPVDRIYHLACPTGVRNLLPMASEMLRTCSYGTFNVLELARAKQARMLFTSTAEVYGNPLESPQAESYTGNVHPMGPRSAYEEGKRFSEACVAMYVRTHGLNARVVRVFNTFGPGMSLSDTRVIPQLIRSVIEQKPMRVYGDGSQTRAHLYIDDLLAGLDIVMEKGVPGEVYNVGSEKPLSVKKLAELVASLTGHPAGIVYEPHFIEDHLGRRPSVAKARALGWSQNITLRDGLLRMIAHYMPAERPATSTQPQLVLDEKPAAVAS